MTGRLPGTLQEEQAVVKNGTTAKQDQKNAVFAASMNLTKNLIGAGIFSLPSALLKGSALPGVLAMFSVSILCGSSFVLIAFLCQRMRCQTYREIWCMAFGKRTGGVVDAFIIVNGFFACVAYTILVSDFLQKALESIAGLHTPRTVLIWGNTLVFMLPLSHAKDLSALRYTSMMGLAIIAAVFLYIVSDSLNNLESSMSNLKANAFRLDVGIFQTIAISTSAFQAHYNAPRIFGQLGRDLSAHSQTVLQSFGTALVIYACFALAGLGLFGDAVLGNVLRNYQADGNVAIMLSWFGMAFAIIFTYPLVFTAARDSLIGSQASLQRAMKTSPLIAHVAITSSMVCIISTVACCIEDVSTVTGLLGAFIGSSLCWIFPASIYISMAKRSRPADLEAPLMGKGGAAQVLPSNKALYAYAHFLVLFGSASVVVGVRNVLASA
eukprot:TRINITY_DN28858_c0_g1_i1.p1 TRINITY_DN28858_c0_g1~~TRINITY_DN28858_c0_g1_i1.p1  ORF type:complete len:438 (+),score=88.19 TRINITY_DN28858_c0_g1_i1:101-1414(+)